MSRLHDVKQIFSRFLRWNSGMSIIELLIATVLSAIVAGAALDFYATQHENLITQENISEMQQSLRVCSEEISSKLRNAGASLPAGMIGIRGRNTNPDTIAIRYNSAPMSLLVGDHTQKQQANPVHVMRFSDLTGFSAGDRVYIYRPPNGPGEWFTVTGVNENSGSGWKELLHGGQDLVNDPQVGDVILKLQEVRFWVDRTTDSVHTRLMREVNGVAQVYADEVYDLQASYLKTNGTTVTQPAAGDTIVSVDYSLAARTTKRTLKLAGSAGSLKRQTSSHILLRNQPAAS